MMIDWYGAKDAGKWVRLDKNQLIGMIIIIPAMIAMVLVMMFMIYEPSAFMYLVVMPIVICTILFVLTYSYGSYSQTKDMVIKTFNIEDTTVLNVVEKVLEKRGQGYKKLSNNEKLPRFPMKIMEKLELPESNIVIKIQHGTNLGTSIFIGPVGLINDQEIEELTMDLDNAFLPKSA